MPRLMADAPSLSSWPSASVAPLNTSGSGSVAHMPVRISRASWTVRRRVSNRSSSSSEAVLWSDFGVCFSERFSSCGIDS